MELSKEIIEELDTFNIENFHKHSDITNIMITDSPVKINEYIKRCKEIGSKVVSTVEHGWQGNPFLISELCKEHDLKMVVGTEAYWVKDRKENDATNCHIVILARNEKGRQDINEMLSIANEDGFYFKPRIDLDLIMNFLNPNDVFITSACIGGWKYDDAEQIWIQIAKKFGNSFMLEVQYHNSPEQKELNKKILRIAKENNIDIIVGMDSHYIYPEQKEDRTDLLLSKRITYQEDEAETRWYMDFPDKYTCYKRFAEQGVLSHDEIIRAMKNTNIVLDFDDITFDKKLKLPTIYPNKTQEEKDRIYKQLISNEWNRYKQTVPKELHKTYVEEIMKEVNVVLNTKMADYFIFDYELVKLAKSKGGKITYTGRGSGSSFFTNTLLGFSNIDRITSPVTLYPERFVAEDRIIKNNSSPDLDMNLGNVEPFVEAQEELLGKGHVYPMIAFGTLKAKSAFKMFARSQGMNPELANEITKEIGKYEKALVHANEEDKDDISIYDYVDEQYHSYIDASQNYLGLLADKKVHPCGYLIYSGDIRREIGIMRINNKTSNKVVYCACIEGAMADKFGYIKNDLLKVEVVNIISNIYKRIGIPQHTINELAEITKDDKATWDIYARGLTVCVNQMESEGTTAKLMKYKPTNISELTAFIAAIRPSFKSMYSIFESRQPFHYGVRAFDDLIQTKEMPYSFVLYQEQMMKTLNYAGFDMGECYDIIKAISKKKTKVIMDAKDEFIKGFGEKIRETEPELSDEEIMNNCLKVWKIIEDGSRYGFNSSHAYCYAYDSLYCAYLKAHYPYEFYTEILQVYSDRGEKDKVVKIVQEMKKGFGIELGKYKFGLDNREFVADKEHNVIYPSLLALKNFNYQAGVDLYNIKDKNYGSFTDLLIELLENTSLDKTKINILIRLGYFSKFGKNKKLSKVYELFQDRYKKSHKDKTKLARRLEVLEFENQCPNETFGVREQIKNEIETLGYPITKLAKAPNNLYAVIFINDKYSTRSIELWNISTGIIEYYKIIKEDFEICPFAIGSLIEIDDIYTTKAGVKYMKKYKIVG